MTERTISDELRETSSLKPDSKNARRHSESQVSQIALSIERFGFVNRIVVRPDGTIVGGEATWLAVKRLGRDQVECRVVAGLSESEYRALGLALNRLPEGSRWKDDVLADILGDLKSDGEDLAGLGFTDREVDKILDGSDEIEVKEIETGPVEDEFWVSVRGPLAQQAVALKALEQALKPFAGVSVELGTINIG